MEEETGKSKIKVLAGLVVPVENPIPGLPARLVGLTVKLPLYLYAL